MTDIVGRLHEATLDKDNMPRMDSERQVPVGLAREAKSEIERLRAALAEIAAHDDQFSSPQQARAIRDAARRALDDGLPTAEDVRGIMREPKP